MKIAEKCRKTFWRFLRTTNTRERERERESSTNKQTRFVPGNPKKAGELVPRENCRKVSKIFWHFFDDFWRFLPCAKIVEKCRKCFWYFLKLFDVFWRGPIWAGPFCNPLTIAYSHIIWPRTIDWKSFQNGNLLFSLQWLGARAWQHNEEPTSFPNIKEGDMAFLDGGGVDASDELWFSCKSKIKEVHLRRGSLCTSPPTSGGPRTCSQLQQNYVNISRPKLVKKCLSNSQKHFRSVNWTSIILHIQIL